MILQLLVGACCRRLDLGWRERRKVEGQEGGGKDQEYANFLQAVSCFQA